MTRLSSIITLKTGSPIFFFTLADASAQVKCISFDESLYSILTDCNALHVHGFNIQLDKVSSNNGQHKYIIIVKYENISHCNCTSKNMELFLKSPVVYAIPVNEVVFVEGTRYDIMGIVKHIKIIDDYNTANGSCTISISLSVCDVSIIFDHIFVNENTVPKIGHVCVFFDCILKSQDYCATCSLWKPPHHPKFVYNGNVYDRHLSRI